jgi:tripeptidyl-peptidase I
VCQAEAGQFITSGGGFSTYYLQPSYQKEAVARYFKLAAAAGKSAVTGYKADGRGYPDISLAGFDYAVGIGGTIFGVSGTSASCPAIAGFFSNINAARIAGGKGPIGWVNPVLYANHTLFVKDITSGHNKCGATGVCCPQGFYAMPGWDPTTGLGSINYQKLEDTFLSLGRFVNGVIHSPTRGPTIAPSSVNAQVLALSFTPAGKMR